MMRKIDLIVIHCSATRADRSLTPDDLEMQHRRRGLYALSGRFGPVVPVPRIQRNRLSLLHPQGWNSAPHPTD